MAGFIAGILSAIVFCDSSVSLHHRV
jgi:hypothetical protein